MLKNKETTTFHPPPREGIERSTGSHHRQAQISDTRQIKGKRKKNSIDHVFRLKLQQNVTHKAELPSPL